MAVDSNFDDDLSSNEYNSNFTEELHFFIDIVKAMDSIHEAIFPCLPGDVPDVPPAPERIIGRVYAPDFEKKNPFFSDSRAMSVMMIRIASYGWVSFRRKFDEVNSLYTKYKRMSFLTACIECDMKDYLLEMVFFYRLLFWKYKREEEEAKKRARVVKMLQTKRERIAKMLQELKEKEQKIKEMEESGND